MFDFKTLCVHVGVREREEGLTDFFWLNIEVCTGYIYFSDFTTIFYNNSLFLYIFGILYEPSCFPCFDARPGI